MKQKRKKLGRKLIGFLLTLAMVVGLMPGISLTVYAAGTVTEVSTADAFKSAIEKEGEIKLTGDFDLPLSNDLLIEKAVIIDLNGHTINVQNVGLDCSWSIDAPVTIKDSASGGAIINPSTGYAFLVRGDSLTLEGGTLEFTGNGYGIDVYWKPFTMTGGTIKSNGYSIWRDGAKVSISGGTINGDFMGTDGEIVITGGSFSFDPSALLKEGYYASKVRDYWVVNAAVYYNVTLSGGANATTSGGATSQTGLTDAMTTVTYTANTGYYFEDFTDITNNGITATRTSDTVVTVSGTPTADATITVPDAVEKTAATVTKAPAAKTLTYTGLAQELVTVGTATGGTMQYALGTDATTAPANKLYTISIPSATNVGTYFVWYKAKGDASDTDSVAACVTATISPCSISGATVTLDKTEIPHTGSEISVSVTSVKLGNTELTAKDYEVSGTTKATDKGTYTVTVTGKGNYKDTASAQWTITDGKDGPQNADGQVQTEGFNTSVKIKQKPGKLTISWDKVEGVAKVEVYATYCGKDFSSKPTKTTAGNKVTIKKLKGKELDFTKNFKFRLVAYDSTGKKIGKIANPHLAGKENKEYTNPKSMKLSKTSITLSVGHSEKIKASVKREDKNKKLLPKKHVDKFRYRSTNSNVAKVDSNGNITGVGAGTCEVYVYAQNGLAKKVAVTVN